MLTPYAETAADYLMKGWTILPLPERSKFAPPTGYTGSEAITAPEELSLGEWLETGSNIALRLPQGVVGIDIDAYKDAGRGYAGMVKELGALPETVGFTSREDVKEGATLLFTIPKGLELIGGVGTVDVIQNHHRYVVAAPSIHPSGRAYRRVTSSGMDFPWVPEPEELPELPESWLERLKAVETPVDLFEGIGFEVAEGSACKKMNSLLKGAIIRLREKQMGRHDLMVRATWAMTGEAAKGHSGYDKIIPAYERAWIKTFSAAERKSRPLSLEFDGAVRGAQRKIGGAGKFPSCACENTGARNGSRSTSRAMFL